MGWAAATTVNAGEQAAGACPRQGVGVCVCVCVCMCVSVSACIGPGLEEGKKAIKKS